MTEKVNKNQTESRAQSNSLCSNYWTSASCLIITYKMSPPQCSNVRLAKRVKGSSDEKHDYAERCEYMQGFHNCYWFLQLSMQ